MRIAVIGAGGTGGYFGGLLARAGEEVTFIARGAHLAAIRKNGLTMGEIRACQETCDLLKGTMEEVEAVARASGAKLPEGCVQQSVDFFGSLEPSMGGSMYYDLAAGRRLELDVLNGAVVRLGGEHGISTPFNFAIYAALKPYLNGAPSAT